MKNISFILYVCTLSAFAMPHENSSSNVRSANMKELGYEGGKLFGIEQDQMSLTYLQALGISVEKSTMQRGIAPSSAELKQKQAQEDWLEGAIEFIDEFETYDFSQFFTGLGAEEAAGSNTLLNSHVMDALINMCGKDKKSKDVFDALNKRVIAELENNVKEHEQGIIDAIQVAMEKLDKEYKIEILEDSYRSFESEIAHIVQPVRSRLVKDTTISAQDAQAITEAVAALPLQQENADKLVERLKDVEEGSLVKILSEMQLTAEDKAVIKSSIHNTILEMLANTAGYEQTAKASFKHHFAALAEVSKSKILSEEGIANVFKAFMSDAWQAIAGALAEANAPVAAVKKSDASIITELQKEDLGLLRRLGSVFSRSSETTEGKRVKAIFAAAEKAYGATALNEGGARIFPDYATTKEQRALIDAQTYKVYEAVRAVAAEARGNDETSAENKEIDKAISDAMKIFRSHDLAKQVAALKAHLFWNVLMAQLPEDAAVEYIKLLSKNATAVKSHLVRANNKDGYNRKIEALVVAVNSGLVSDKSASAEAKKQYGQYYTQVKAPIKKLMDYAKKEIKASKIDFSKRQLFEVFGEAYDLLTKDLNKARANQPSTFAEDLTQLVFSRDAFINNPEFGVEILEKLKEYRDNMFKLANVSQPADVEYSHDESSIALTSKDLASKIWPGIVVSSVDKPSLIAALAQQVHAEKDAAVKQRLLEEYKKRVAELDGALELYSNSKKLLKRINLVLPNSGLDGVLIWEREVLNGALIESIQNFLTAIEGVKSLQDGKEIGTQIAAAVKALGLDREKDQLVNYAVASYIGKQLKPEVHHDGDESGDGNTDGLHGDGVPGGSAE